MNQPVSDQKPASSEELDLGHLFRIALRHWRVVLAIAGAVTLVVAFFILGQTKIYRASLTLKIDPSALRPLGKDVQSTDDSSNVYWTNKEYYETQYKILASRKVAAEVVHLLRLHQDSHFLRGLPSSAEAAPVDGVSVTDAAEMLRRRLDVTPVKNSRLVELSFEDADAARAQRIVSAVADAYIRQNLDSSVTNIGSAAEWLNDQLAKLKTELETTELALHEYKKENRLLSASLDDQSSILRNEMQQLSTALTTARAKREQLSSRVAQLSRVDPQDPSQLPASELLSSSMLQSLRAGYISARTMVEGMKSGGRGENHPEVLAATASLERTREALLDEVKNIQEAARRDLLAAEKEIAGLSGLYEASEKKAYDLNLLEIEYKRLARAKENTERLHAIVLERSKESELNGQMRFNNVSVVDSPLLPTGPVKPRVPLMIALGSFGGLVLGFGFVILREKLDQRLKNPQDLENALQVTCIGVLPEVAGKTTIGPSYGRARRRGHAASEGQSPELWIHHHPSSNVAEAARTLRTNLVFMSPDRPFTRLLVTSAGPMDGKTTVATTLAISLAQSGKSVLLVDADLRRPRLQKVFRLQGVRDGVTSALLRPEILDSAILETEIPKLSLLPAGPLPPNPAELLHSSSFERLLETLNARFDCVVIDSPPLVPVTDAAVLSRIVDATVVVVRSMQTRKDHAKQALRSLRDVNANIAGAVLNGVDFESNGYGYYYYYYGNDPTSPEATS